MYVVWNKRLIARRRRQCKQRFRASPTECEPEELRGRAEQLFWQAFSRTCEEPLFIGLSHQQWDVRHSTELKGQSPDDLWIYSVGQLYRDWTGNYAECMLYVVPSRWNVSLPVIVKTSGKKRITYIGLWQNVKQKGGSIFFSKIAKTYCFWPAYCG